MKNLSPARKIFFYLTSLVLFFLFSLTLLYLKTWFTQAKYYTNYSLTNLVYEDSWDNSVLMGEKILKGEKVSGHFIAQADRLGTVAIKFDAFNRLNNDQIFFRIKEKGEEKWFYENIYATYPIRQEIFWPFGFPVISDSKDKSYEFEIESTMGTPDNAVGLNPKQNSFITIYSFPKEWLLNHKDAIPFFLFSKFSFPLIHLDKNLPVIVLAAFLLLLFLPLILPKLISFLILMFLKTVRLTSRFTKIMLKKYPYVLVSLLILFVTVSSCLLDKNVFVEDSNPRNLVYYHPWDNLLLTGEEILAGQKVYGEFTALQNRLAVLDFRVNCYGRNNHDQMIFRLKEKNKPTSVYENTYSTFAMCSSSFWQLGFPPLNDSKGKTYQFEMESVKGTPGNAVGLPTPEKFFLSQYSYSWAYLKEHKGEIFPFLLNKILLPFSRLDRLSWKYILLFPLLPLLFHFLRLNKIKEIAFLVKPQNDFEVLAKPEKEGKFFYVMMVVFTAMLTIFDLVNLKFYPLLPNESFEWLVYEITALSLPLIFLSSEFLLNRRKNFRFAQKWVKLFFLISFAVFLTILFFRDPENTPRQFIVFLSLGVLPFLPWLKNQIKKSGSKLKVITALLQNKYFLINMIGIFATSTFFSETLLHQSWLNRSVILKYFFILAGLGYLFFTYSYHLKFSFRDSTVAAGNRFRFYKPIFKKIFSFIFLSFASLFLFVLIHREVISYVYYFHNIYHVGPALDILRGKSLLYDTPSQYGYLSIHFIALILKNFGETIPTFDFFHSVLFVISTVIVGLIGYKLTKKIIPSVLLALIYIGCQTFFSDYGSFLTPGSGPIRFGLGLLMCLILLSFPSWLSFLLNTILASLSVFWSAETAIYVVPAWIFTCLVVSKMKYEFNRDFFKSSFLKIGAFVTTTILLTGLILIKEYRPGNGFPPIWNYWDFPMQAAKTGLYAVYMPMSGNYYLTVLIMILGLGVLTHLLYRRLYSQYLPALAFIGIYNVAIFSYFVNRSWYSLTIGLFGFMAIELALIYKACEQSMKLNREKLKVSYGIPVMIFFVFFLYKTNFNLPENIIAFKYNLNQLTNPQKSTLPLLNAVSQNLNLDAKTPLLLEIARNYKVDTKNVVLLSIYDTLYLSEGQAINFLPLNPASMTFSLPNWREKYVFPQIEKIPPQTIFIWDDNAYPYDDKFSPSMNEIKNKIEKIYTLTYLGEIKDKKITIYKILGKKK